MGKPRSLCATLFDLWGNGVTIYEVVVMMMENVRRLRYTRERSRRKEEQWRVVYAATQLQLSSPAGKGKAMNGSWEILGGSLID